MTKKSAMISFGYEMDEMNDVGKEERIVYGEHFDACKGNWVG
jgi:hypothetical protein